jgi:hypothetical protein
MDGVVDVDGVDPERGRDFALSILFLGQIFTDSFECFLNLRSSA